MNILNMYYETRNKMLEEGIDSNDRRVGIMEMLFEEELGNCLNNIAKKDKESSKVLDFTADKRISN